MDTIHSLALLARSTSSISDDQNTNGNDDLQLQLQSNTNDSTNDIICQTPKPHSPLMFPLNPHPLYLLNRKTKKAGCFVYREKKIRKKGALLFLYIYAFLMDHHPPIACIHRYHHPIPVSSGLLSVLPSSHHPTDTISNQSPGIMLHKPHLLEQTCPNL